MTTIQHKNMKQKSDIHLMRKIWHCVGICLMAAGYHYFGSRVAWILILTASIIFIPLDLLRQKNEALNKLTLKIFGPVMRRHEYNAISGMTYLFLGCIFLLILREPQIIMLTLLFLAFGDPIASYFGIRYGKDRILGNKTLQGTIAAFVACTVIAGVFYYLNNLMIERLLIVAPLSGLIGALAELIPIGKIDDNFTFPVVSSVLLLALFKVYGGFGV